MFLDRPILGFGFGQFPEAKLPYLSDRSTPLDLESIRPLAHHNTYLSLLVELGLMGFLLYMALLGMWLLYGWRLARGSRQPDWARHHGVLFLCAMATYAVQMLFHDVTLTSIDHSIIYLLAGMTVGMSASGRTPQRPDARRRLGRRSDQVQVCEQVGVSESDG
jgi:O-antigen ligase